MLTYLIYGVFLYLSKVVILTDWFELIQIRKPFWPSWKSQPLPHSWKINWFVLTRFFGKRLGDHIFFISNYHNLLLIRAFFFSNTYFFSFFFIWHWISLNLCHQFCTKISEHCVDTKKEFSPNLYPRIKKMLLIENCA